MSGTYDIDAGDSMQVIGKDREVKRVKFTTLIHVDDTEYPTQMISQRPRLSQQGLLGYLRCGRRTLPGLQSIDARRTAAVAERI